MRRWECTHVWADEGSGGSVRVSGSRLFMAAAEVNSSPTAPHATCVQILASRTEKRQVGGKAGNTFSVATFAVVDEAALAAKAAADEAGAAGEEFWKTLLPEAVKVGSGYGT